MAATFTILISAYAVLCMLVCTIRWVKRLFGKKRPHSALLDAMRRDYEGAHYGAGGHVTLQPDRPVSQRPAPQPPKPQPPKPGTKLVHFPEYWGSDYTAQSCDHEWRLFRSVDPERPAYKKCVLCAELAQPKWHYEPAPQDCVHDWDDLTVTGPRGTFVIAGRSCRKCGREDTRGSWQPTS